MKQSVHKPVSFCWEWARNPNRKNYEATQGITAGARRGAGADAGGSAACLIPFLLPFRF